MLSARLRAEYVMPNRVVTTFPGLTLSGTFLASAKVFSFPSDRLYLVCKREHRVISNCVTFLHQVCSKYSLNSNSTGNTLPLKRAIRYEASYAV